MAAAALPLSMWAPSSGGKGFTALLVFSALIGILVSLASWCFLEGVHALQQWVYTDLPGQVGFASVPWWWPLAGALRGRRHHRGRHSPAPGARRPHACPGPEGRAAHPADRAPRGPAGGDRHHQPGDGVGSRGAPDRPGRRSRPPDRASDQEGRARSRVDRAGRRRELRGHLHRLRQPAHRGRHHDRGRRLGRADAHPDAPARAHRRRGRLARLHGHGVAHRPQLGRVRDQSH